MISATIRQRLPEATWTAEVSRSFPKATLRLLSGIRTGDTAVELGETVAPDPGPVSEAVAAHPAIRSHRRLEATDTRSLSRYETTATGVYELVEHTSVPVEFPISVQDGWAEFDFTGTREGFEAFRSALERHGEGVELVSIVGSDDSPELLTDRQRELLRTAIRSGYYEVPREGTLVDVAEAVGVDKSTASGVLRRGEARLVKRFISGTATEWRR